MIIWKAVGNKNYLNITTQNEYKVEGDFMREWNDICLKITDLLSGQSL